MYVNSTNTPTTVWTLSGNQQNQWLQARIPLPAQTNTYTVSVNRTNGYKSLSLFLDKPTHILYVFINPYMHDERKILGKYYESGLLWILPEYTLLWARYFCSKYEIHKLGLANDNHILICVTNSWRLKEWEEPVMMGILL